MKMISLSQFLVGIFYIDGTLPYIHACYRSLLNMFFLLFFWWVDNHSNQDCTVKESNLKPPVHHDEAGDLARSLVNLGNLRSPPGFKKWL